MEEDRLVKGTIQPCEQQEAQLLAERIPRLCRSIRVPSMHEETQHTILSDCRRCLASISRRERRSSSNAEASTTARSCRSCDDRSFWTCMRVRTRASVSVWPFACERARCVRISLPESVCACVLHVCACTHVSPACARANDEGLPRALSSPPRRSRRQVSTRRHRPKTKQLRPSPQTTHLVPSEYPSSTDLVPI